MDLTSYHLLENDSLTLNEYHFLYKEIQNGKSFLITGSMGSGKSTILKLLIDLLDKNKRIVISDEMNELTSATNNLSSIGLVENSFIKEAFKQKHTVLIDDTLRKDEMIAFNLFDQVILSVNGTQSPKQAIERYYTMVYLQQDILLNSEKVFPLEDFIEKFDYIIVSNKRKISFYEPIITNDYKKNNFDSIYFRKLKGEDFNV